MSANRYPIAPNRAAIFMEKIPITTKSIGSTQKPFRKRKRTIRQEKKMLITRRQTDKRNREALRMRMLNCAMLSWRAISFSRSSSLTMLRERSMARPKRLVTVSSRRPTAEISTAGEIDNCINFESDSILKFSISEILKGKEER